MTTNPHSHKTVWRRVATSQSRVGHAGLRIVLRHVARPSCASEGKERSADV